jgi:hypothetical protein
MLRAEGVQTHHERPDGVVFRFQIAKDLIGCGSSDPRHVLSQHPTRSNCSHQSHVLRPQVAFVFFAALLPGD